MNTFNRPNWDIYFLKITEDVGRRSTCFRRQVGAVIVNKDHQIVATGFNGKARGNPHCDEIGCIKETMGFKSGEGNDWCTAVHAEQNALLQAGKESNGSTLYLSVYPCKICARLIVNAGIKKVVIAGNYPDATGLETLEKCGIIIILHEQSTKQNENVDGKTGTDVQQTPSRRAR
jgi:dCMP deaminase